MEAGMGYYDVIVPVDGDASYDGDFAAWAFDQARRLRALQSNDLDIANIAEEIESLGRAAVSKLEGLLEVVLLHLLKWDYQPLRRCTSWEVSVLKCRRQVVRHLKGNPSLKHVLDETVEAAYGDARLQAAKETGQSVKNFPEDNPYDWHAMMNRELKYADPE